MRYLQQYRAAGSRQQDDDVATKVIHIIFPDSFPLQSA